MAAEKDEPQPARATDLVVQTAADPAGLRRWQIGIAVTIVFGVLGVLMSVLHYMRSADPSPGSPAPAATGDGPKKHNGRGH